MQNLVRITGFINDQVPDLISRITAYLAKDVCWNLNWRYRDALPAPLTSPGPDGSLMLCWTTDDHHLEIEIIPGDDGIPYIEAYFAEDIDENTSVSRDYDFNSVLEALDDLEAHLKHFLVASPGNILLSERDWNRFCEIISGDTEPNENLKKAFKDYRDAIESGLLIVDDDTLDEELLEHLSQVFDEDTTIIQTSTSCSGTKNPAFKDRDGADT